jgi:AhpD family alkylhydroperoxidase
MIRPLARPRTAPHPPLLAQMRRDFGMTAEPILLHASSPALLAAAWASLRETVLVSGRLGRAAKESIALAVSEANRCPYCVDAHSVTLGALGEHAEVARLRVGAPSAASDPRRAELVAWARASRSAATARPLPAGWDAVGRAEAIGTALCFHYINRLVRPFLGDSPAPLPVGWLRRLALGLTERWIFRPAMGRPLVAGDALPFLEPPPTASAPPAHLGWAAPAAPILASFWALDRASAALAEEALGGPGTACVLTELASWQGEELPLGDRRIEEAAHGAPPTLRLALLAALAPHRLTAQEVAACRRHGVREDALVGVLAWASFQASRRLSEWLGWDRPTDLTHPGAPAMLARP